MTKIIRHDQRKEKSERLRREADIYLTKNDYKTAHNLYEQSLALDPKNDRALNNLAILHEEKGEINLAIYFYKKASLIDEAIPEAKSQYHQNLASAYEQNNQNSAAIWTYQTAVSLEINSKSELSKNYLRLLQSLHIQTYDRTIFNSLTPLIYDNALDTQAVADIYFEQIAHLITDAKAEKTNDTLDVLNLFEENTNTLKLISTQLINSPIIEKEVRNARRKISQLLMCDNYNGEHLPFLAAISAQCSLNGYIYNIEVEEKRTINLLKHSLANKKISISRRNAINYILASYGSYGSYSQNKNSSKIAYPLPPIYTGKLIIGHQEIFAMAPCNKKEITRDFYEAFPYPTWLSVPSYTETTLDETLSQLNIEKTSSQENADFILVAGCGTGRHAIQLALTYPKAIIIGLDISMASLQYALTKTIDLKIKNITFVQGSIYDIKKLKIKFRLIECIGVLHHLEHPIKGCRALLSTLKKDGVLKLGLYSDLARRPLKKLSYLLSESGITFSPNNLPNIRDFVLRNSSIDVFNEIIKSSDFYNRSGCMDLFFNPLERTYTVQKIFNLSRLTETSFAGFERSGEQNSPGFRYFHDGTSLNAFLESWDTFEKSHPNFFGAMYLFWLKPNYTE